MQHAAKTMLYTLLCAWGACISLPQAQAQSPTDSFLQGEALGTLVDGHAPLGVRLVSDAAVVTPGDSVRMGLWIRLDPGWHIYWQQPGAAGLSTQITWRSGDALLGEMAWPVPEVFRESDGIVTFGYAGESLLWVPATISDSVGESLLIEANIEYLACNIICSPGHVTVRRTLPVGEASVPSEAAVQNLFERYHMRLPMAPEAAGLHIETHIEPESVRVDEEFSVQLCVRWTEPAGRAALHLRREPFIPDAMEGLSVHVVGTRAAVDADGAAVLSFVGRAQSPSPADSRAGPKRYALSGIIQLEGEHGPLQPVTVNVALPMRAGPAPTQAALPNTPKPSEMAPDLKMPPAAAADVSVAYALALALLGGLVLNLMPCVLPVLALKLVGIAQLHQQARRGAVLVHGVAYAAGVVGSMAALASVVCVLRAAGTAVGWGFQFQEPWFVASVASILVLFALNCFGVFELYVTDAGIGQAAERARGFRRSAFDGVLAVILATPCSAPFLGTAIAFALQQRAWLIFVIFMTIGAGLALPYVLLSSVPHGRRFVPKPGVWMLHLKTLLGFLLLTTAVWLVWIMGRFAGVDGMATLLVVLVVVALCAWIFGRASQHAPERSLLYFVVLLAVVAIINVSGLHRALKGGARAQSGATSIAPDGWQSYSQAALDEGLQRKQAIFVDFTADWCLTCKYNEAHVLGDAAIVQALRDKHVLMLRADWTRRDEAIRITLGRFGRAGVPMYLLYHPNSPQMPQLLPEILSVSQLRDALDNLP